MNALLFGLAYALVVAAGFWLWERLPKSHARLTRERIEAREAAVDHSTRTYFNMTPREIEASQRRHNEAVRDGRE